MSGPTRGPEQTPEGRDAVTATYEEVGEAFAREFGNRLLDAAGSSSGVRLLDVAAGPGTLAIEAGRRGASVTAVDFSPRMVERVRERAALEDLDVRAEVMDAQDLTLDDDAFDVAVCNFGIIFLPDRAQGLAELVRVVRPGGHVGVSVWSTPDRLGFMQLFGGAVRRVLPDAPAPPAPPWLEVATPDGLSKELRRAGLEHVEIRTVTAEWHVPSAEWLRDRIEGVSPASKAMVERLPEDAREAVLDAMVDLLHEQFTSDGQIRVPNEAHLGVATVPGR